MQNHEYALVQDILKLWNQVFSEEYRNGCIEKKDTGAKTSIWRYLDIGITGITCSVRCDDNRGLTKQICSFAEFLDTGLSLMTPVILLW